MKTYKVFVIALAVILAALLIVVGVLTGIGWRRSVQAARDRVAFSCGPVTLSISKQFLLLPAVPAQKEASTLDAWGCHHDVSGCLCVKTVPQDKNSGVIFRVARADGSSFDVPQDEASQKAYLSNLAALMVASAPTSTNFSHAYGTFQDYPGLILTGVSTSANQTLSSDTIKTRDIYFIRDGNVYDISFYSSEMAFSLFWPMIERSLTTLTFSP